MKLETEKIPCIICESTDQQMLYDHGRGGPFDTVVCRYCGFVFISPREIRENVQAYYDKGGYRRHSEEELTPEVARRKVEKDVRPLKMAERRFLAISKTGLVDVSGTMFDVGASFGFFMKLWRDAGWDVHGCEPDVVTAQAGMLYHGLDILPLLYENKRLEPGHYDFIALCHVLEHCANAREVIRKARQELTDAGHLYIELPTIDRPYGGDLERFFWREHVNYFSVKTLTGLLRQEGFEVIRRNWHGFFLWLIARKSAPQEIDFPCDDPERVIRRTQNAQLRYLSRKVRELEKENADIRKVIGQAK